MNEKLASALAVWDVKAEFFAKTSVTNKNQFASQLAANIFCPGPSYFFTIDFSTRKFTYVSQGIKEVLGISPTEFGLHEFFERLHPDDVQHLTRCEEIITDFLFHQVPLKKMRKYKFSYCFRMQHADGTYRHILHQAITISQDEKGRMGQVLDIETDIGAFAPAYSKRLSIIGLDGEPSYLGIDPTLEGFELSPTKKRKLTKRELEVVRLLSKGDTTEEIGSLLGISIGTVQKHRANILKKMKCRNTAAVIAKCIKLGYV